MNEKEENIYIQGERNVWNKLLSDCLIELGYNNPGNKQKYNWILEREAVIVQLRDLCNKFGDNNWSEELHLADIIEKHLRRHLV